MIMDSHILAPPYCSWVRSLYSGAVGSNLSSFSPSFQLLFRYFLLWTLTPAIKFPILQNYLPKCPAYRKLMSRSSTYRWKSELFYWSQGNKAAQESVPRPFFPLCPAHAGLWATLCRYLPASLVLGFSSCFPLWSQGNVLFFLNLNFIFPLQLTFNILIVPVVQHSG